MASLKVSVGTFFKKVFDAQGVVTTTKIPFLPKTLAKLVYMADGESIEHAMLANQNAVTNVTNRVTKVENGENGASTLEFESMAAYEAAIANGTASPNAIYVVKD